MNGKMSWMGAGGMPWNPEWNGGNGTEEENIPREFCRSLKPIRVSERYKAIEPEEEKADRLPDNYADTDDDDSEPGDSLKPADPSCRADRACPYGGIRNWNQERCDCGSGIYWPVEDGENMEGLFKCKGYTENKLEKTDEIEGRTKRR